MVPVNFYKFQPVVGIHKNFLMGLLLLGGVWAGELRLDCNGFIRAAQNADPILREESQSIGIKEHKIQSVKADALLPKFEVSMAYGPAPGLKDGINADGDSVEMWDFTKIGPYFATELTVAQPLNFGRLQTGLRAARADLDQTKWDIQAKRVRKSAEYQEYYFGLLLAREMVRLADDAAKQMQKAQDRLQEKLDEQEEEEESEETDTVGGSRSKVSQDDLLDLKASRFQIDEAVADAQLGLRKAELGIRFVLSLPDSTVFVPLDSVLVQRQESLPPLDTLRIWMHSASPDLRRLQAGLDALQGKVQLEEAKLGPEFFVFGSFKFAKSWAGDRRTLNKDAFVEDPVNTLTGTLGVGMRYRLNYWSTLEKVRISRAEHRQLKYKDAYAQDGLDAQLEISYQEFLAARDKLESVRRSVRATEALLKGVAMRFDVDPSEGTKLVAAYKRDLLMQKDYYFAVYRYNLAVADLLSKVGIGPAELARSNTP